MITENSTTLISILKGKWPRIVAVLVIVAAVEVANDYTRLDRPAFSLAAVALMVTALSIFLVFRVGEAYARWWEARTLWGAIVNSSRRLARQVTTLIAAAPEGESARAGVGTLQRELVYRQIAWVNALRLTLRREDSWEELGPFLEDAELTALSRAASRPTQILQTQGARLAEARAAGHLSDFDLLMLDNTLAALHEAQGACERIKNTAFPDRVAYVTQFTAWAMAVLIAISVIDPDNRLDPIDLVVVPLLMLSFIITERLGAELRNPFDNLPNDTPMTALCRGIEIDLRQQLGEKQVPPPIEPVKGVLM